MQVFYVGGLFRQFANNEISESGIRRMAAVQLAISKLNNKTDGIFDNLLRNAQVC